jgi:lysyl-tRNA synthetase class 2
MRATVAVQAAGAVKATTVPGRPPLSRLAVARLVQAGGVLEVWRNLLPPPHGRVVALAHVVPVAGLLTARAAATAAGVLLVHLGAGLRRGRRTAFHMGVVVAGVGIVLQLAHGLDLDGAAVSAGLLALLVGTRDRFRAVGDPGGPVRAAGAVAGLVGAGFAIGMLEVAVRANRLVGHPPLSQWAAHVLLGMVGVTGPLRFAHPLGATAVSVTTGTFGLLAAAVGALRLLRPRRRPPGFDHAEERRRARHAHRARRRHARLLRAARRPVAAVVPVREGRRRPSGAGRGQPRRR